LFVLSMAAVLTPVVPIAVSGALILLALLTNGVVVARLVLSWRLTRPSSVADAAAVVFDLDGTVADTMPFLTGLATELLGRYGLTAGDARRRYLSTVGIDFASQLEELFPGHPTNREVAAEFETRKRATFLRCRVFPDVTETLALLRRAGVRRFLCSSTTRDLVTAYVCAHGLDDDLDDYTGFERGCSKDRQLDLLVEKHRLPRDRVLFVGDAPRDAELLRRTGVHFIGVHRVVSADQFRLRGLHSVDDLAALTRLWQRDTRRRRAVAPTTPSRPPPTRSVR
jgi:phosphoglycolate phosphatase